MRVSEHQLIDKFKQFNSNKAIVFKGQEHSYKELLQEITELHHFIVSNVAQDDVVAILSECSFKSIALLFALAINKNIIVPITTTNENEIKDRLMEGQVNKLIKFENDSAKVVNVGQFKKHKYYQQLVEKKVAGLVLFSSGTSGKPKAMVHDLDNIIKGYLSNKSRKITMLVFLMFDHIGGLNTVFNALASGMTIVIPEKREPAFICSLIETYKVNVLPASPTFLNLMFVSGSYQEYDLSSLRMITYGTEIMPVTLLERLKKCFPKTKLLQTFGTSETGIAQTISEKTDSTYMKLDNSTMQYKIVDKELWLKSKTQVLGYLNDDMSAFTEDGWFKTGDLVETNEGGYLRIVGRAKEIINVGGQKVLPAEVESVLLSCDELADVLVYGELNAITGQTVVANVVLKTDIDKAIAKKEMRKQCLTKLDRYKVPSKFNFVENIDYSVRYKKIRNLKA